MERRRLLAWFVGGLLLLSGAAYQTSPGRQDWRRVGVTSIGDTMWIDTKNPSGEFWGARVQGAVTRDPVFITLRVSCAERRMEAQRAVLELQRDVVDTVCRRLGR